MINDKVPLEKRARKFGYSESKGFFKLGFVLDSLGAGQIPFTCVYAANTFLEATPWINISIFFLESIPPCVEPSFARFSVRDAIGYDGSLVATSYNTILAIKDYTRARRFFYIQDVRFLENTSDSNVDSIMKDKSIVKFTRGKDHYDLLTSKGYEICPTIVEDFNIHKIMEIING